jgi:predicted nucleic acid-binding protein
MLVYADSSFLLSLYTADTHHERALDLVRRDGTAIPFTPLQAHEVRNGLRLAVFRKDLSGMERQAVLASLEADVRAGFLVETGLAWPTVFEQAETLSAAHTERMGTRGMDVLHVAAACAMGASDFLTFDDRQKALAAKAGLKVRP